MGTLGDEIEIRCISEENSGGKKVRYIFPRNSRRSHVRTLRDANEILYMSEEKKMGKKTVKFLYIYRDCSSNESKGG